MLCCRLAASILHHIRGNTRLMFLMFNLPDHGAGLLAPECNCKRKTNITNKVKSDLLLKRLYIVSQSKCPTSIRTERHRLVSANVGSTTPAVVSRHKVNSITHLFLHYSSPSSRYGITLALSHSLPSSLSPCPALSLPVWRKSR